MQFYLTDKKKSTDIRIYREPEWVKEEKYFHDMIRKAMKKYETFLLKMDVDDEVETNVMYCQGADSYTFSTNSKNLNLGQYYGLAS